MSSGKATTPPKNIMLTPVKGVGLAHELIREATVIYLFIYLYLN